MLSVNFGSLPYLSIQRRDGHRERREAEVMASSAYSRLVSFEFTAVFLRMIAVFSLVKDSPTSGTTLAAFQLPL